MLFSRKIKQNWISARYFSDVKGGLIRFTSDICNELILWKIFWDLELAFCPCLLLDLATFLLTVGTNIYVTCWNPVTFQFVYFIAPWWVTSAQFQQPDTDIALQIQDTFDLICNHYIVVNKKWFAFGSSLDQSVTLNYQYLFIYH
jgi:hypothetical protein